MPQRDDRLSGFPVFKEYGYRNHVLYFTSPPNLIWRCLHCLLTELDPPYLPPYPCPQKVL